MMKWQPIETAPKDETEIFVGFYIGGVWIVRCARYVCAKDWAENEPDVTDGWWSYRNSVTQEQLDGIYEPKYWCPMPDPPEDE